MRVVRGFVLIVLKLKHLSGHSQIFHFNSSEVKQRSGCRHRFHFNSNDSKTR